MSTDHYYEFFDREFFDPIWALSWPEFRRKYKSRWAISRKYERGLYNETSLRELISFSVVPEPSPADLEEILEKWTVKRTVRNSKPQFWFMADLIANVPGSQNCSVDEIASEDVAVLISAAVSGYLAGRISSLDLRAVLKVHGCGSPREWIKLSTKQRKLLGTTTEGINYRQPLYPWQGEAACGDDSWTNCLGIRDTRRFLSFINSAWRENWPLLPLKDPTEEQLERPDVELRFQDYSISRELASTAEIVAEFRRPVVFRQWF